MRMTQMGSPCAACAFYGPLFVFAVRVRYVLFVLLRGTWTRGLRALDEPCGQRGALHPEGAQPSPRHSSFAWLQVRRFDHHGLRQFRDSCALPRCDLLTSPARLESSRQTPSPTIHIKMLVSTVSVVIMDIRATAAARAGTVVTW
jgi:hypothetical protein